MKRMSENPKVREWWAMTDGMQVCIFRLCFGCLDADSAQESPISGALSSAEGPGWWKVLEEVFHMD